VSSDTCEWVKSRLLPLAIVGVLAGAGSLFAGYGILLLGAHWPLLAVALMDSKGESEADRLSRTAKWMAILLNIPTFFALWVWAHPQDWNVMQRALSLGALVIPILILLIVCSGYRRGLKRQELPG
jgi:hypothetical protein